jgi:hypothetical protein
MVMSTPESVDPAPQPEQRVLASIAEQSEAIDRLIELARDSIRVFDRDLSQTGWDAARRAERLAVFLRGKRTAKLEIIVHDTRWIESSCPRLRNLLRAFADSITLYRTGGEARSAMDPLMIVDGRHFLHRFHADQPRAALAIEQPAATKPLANRFDEIWASGEPGLSGTTLGL